MSKTITKVIAGLGVVAGLGVAALPLTSYAATDSAPVIVSVTVSDTLSLAMSGTTSATVTPNTANLTTLSSTATVSTNEVNGYKLTVINTNADTDLDSVNAGTGAGDGTAGSAGMILAVAGAPVAGTSTWAVQAGGAYTGAVGISDTTWSAMPPSSGTALTIRDRAGVASSEASTVKYGVGLASNIATGTYANSVTYTAVSN